MPLELYVILFDSEHYVTTQGTICLPHQKRFLKDNPLGKNKLKQVEEELKKLIKIRHENLLSIFAVKLSSAYSEHDYPRLSILLEQRPPLSLRDVLEDCDFLREDRALVCHHLPREYIPPWKYFQAYIRQVLAALSALHAQDIFHRGISPACVYLANPPQVGQPKVVKLGKSGYFTRLLDLYRSNKFGGRLDTDDSRTSEGW